MNDLLKKYLNDKKTLKMNPTPEFVITLDGNQYTKRQEAFDEMYAQYLLATVDHNGNGSVEIGQFRGLEVFLEKGVTQNQLVLKGEASYRVGFNEETGIGNITRLMNLPEHVFELSRSTQDEIQDTQQQITSAKKEIEKPFTRQNELDELVKKQREITKEIELAALRKDSTIQVKQEEK